VLARKLSLDINMEDKDGVRTLVEDIAKALVDVPNEVSVNAVAGEQATVFELRVAQGDLGKVIGKQGRTARSIRTVGCGGYEAKPAVLVRDPGVIL
jgi:hypothetical protein